MDVLLLSNAHDKKERIIKDLEIYGITTSMELNVQKSTNYFLRLEVENQNRLFHCFLLRKSNFWNFKYYLGYWLNPNGYGKRDQG